MLQLISHSPKRAIKALIKQRPLRAEIDLFKTNLKNLRHQMGVIDAQPTNESEEHLKNNIRDFLRDTFYKETHAINTKDKKDLVIHLGKTTDTNVAVVVEAKRPSNFNEMITPDNANKKAFHELILYYFDERQHNTELKHLIITDINQWYVFDANDFDKHIYRNTSLKKLYETKQQDKKDNPFFYEEVAKLLAKSNEELSCTFFNLKQYDAVINEDSTNSATEKDDELVALYTLLSPKHLLKQHTANDSNALNEPFYKELLHIMGLEEAKEGSKLIIRRKLQNRHAGSLIELVIETIYSEDVLRHVPNKQEFGENPDEQTFNIALELCITWINRILFLKLLEGQLVAYNSPSPKGKAGDTAEYQFLNSETIPDFDELFTLFHKVLAINLSDRAPQLKQKYVRVPYLNSSLFDISALEDQTIKIKALNNKTELDLISTTVLKDTKKKQPTLPTLNYLFSFLNAYDFGSDGLGSSIREENKSIINASVLGTVFEKINGYKDGSVYTPSFITMYMCKQSIRLAVLQKFNDAKGWNLQSFDEIHEKIEDIKEANKIINSLKICDPAVGSGHFLVSALNELIAIKSELKILSDNTGKRLKNTFIEIVNDELIIVDEDLETFKYKAQNALRKDISETQRIQETLFREKQTIIENCLFGVDINPKSVLICRLRLWIELLKNAYYTAPEYLTLETLPNIDINIKCGNSLISRFALDADLTKALKSIKYDIKAYRGFVNDYKNEKSKDVKRGLQQIIDTIKSDFKTEINKNSKEYRKLQELQYEFNLLAAPNIFNNDGVAEPQAEYGTSENNKKQKDRIATLQAEINKRSQEFDDIKNNKIYQNAFEWRFEFPEVLNDNGEFEGFDLIIGNPPYIKEDVNKNAFNGLKSNECYQGKMDLWYLFGALGLQLIKQNALLHYIATNNWTTNAGASKFRNYILQNSQFINLTDFGAYMVFDNASIQTMTMLFRKNKEIDDYEFDFRKLNGIKPTQTDALLLFDKIKDDNTFYLNPIIKKSYLFNKTLTFNSDKNSQLLNKIKSKHNFFIRDGEDKKLNIKTEFGGGVDVLQDFLSKASFEKMKGKAKVGDGVFVLSQKEYDNREFSAREKEIIKPYYTTKQLTKYYGNPNNTHWLIYTQSDINTVNSKTRKSTIESYPKIKQHLDNFKTIITSDNAPYGLNRARKKYFFEGEKIFVQRKCPKEPIFTYTDFDCFVSRAFLLIKTDRINLKYLTGLLNSKLVAFWLRKKGKMQGNNYQLDKEPLLEIPIYNPSEKEVLKIATLVDKIIALKAENKDTSKLEQQIDELVYALYELTPEEIKLIGTN